ncbi:hypothetical protein [Prosthecobacter sp.]|uniref:hypothetical protein n=1 Tax=Prosthecobacter sp. TaxID=1965333 RepID=UPI002ABB1CB2|nr:hypothetical protein [Prosthecobacter sp.]MDZ4405167.1 hypothetical protein [Prosthecobacter sp.]
MNSAFIKKNWYLLTPAAILLIPMLMVLFCTVNYGYSLSESMKAVRYFGSTSTRYSQGFSERKFKMVRLGMDGRSVYNTIKNPMERNLPEDNEWLYSLPGAGTEYYHERIIILEKDKNGIPRVKQKVSRFHTPD